MPKPEKEDLPLTKKCPYHDEREMILIFNDYTGYAFCCPKDHFVSNIEPKLLNHVEELQTVAIKDLLNPTKIDGFLSLPTLLFMKREGGYYNPVIEEFKEDPKHSWYFIEASVFNRKIELR